MKMLLKAITISFLLAVPAIANAAPCDTPPPNAEERETIAQRKKPLTVPHYLRSIVTTDDVSLSVQKIPNVKDQEYCFRTAWVHSIDEMELLEHARFLSFHYYTLEADGHILIDRKNGDEIATGNRPYFTEDGSYFMALQKSGAGWGNLEGLGVWRIDENQTKRIFFNALPGGNGELSVRRFHESGCALIAATYGKRPEQSFIVVLSDDVKLDDSKNYEKCIATKMGLSLNQMREKRTASETGPPDWYAVADGPDPVSSGRPVLVHFADKGSIHGLDGHLAITASRLELTERQNEAPQVEIIEYRDTVLVDCEKRRFKILKTEKYGKSGELLSPSASLSPKRSNWTATTSNTSDDRLVSFTCNPEGEVGEQRWPANLPPRKLMEAYMAADWSK